MEYKRLCESDLRFMHMVWEHEPINSTKLTALCREELGWKKSTVYTMLKKLGEKGFLKNEGAVVTALVSREEVQAAESEVFVEQTFGGSLPKFLVAFLGGKTIPDDEVDQLQRLIDKHRRG